MIDFYNTGQVSKLFVVVATVKQSIFLDKVLLLYFFLVASLITTFVQIIIEIIMVSRYNNGGSQQWLSGCEILSACSTEQGPSSTMSQIYNEIDNMMKIVVAEIVCNLIGFVLMIYSTREFHKKLQSAVPPQPARPAAQPAAQAALQRPSVTVCVVVFEMLLEVAQVACSALALKSMEGSITPVNELLFSSLVSKYSENAGLCVLPCCVSSNQITC